MSSNTHISPSQDTGGNVNYLPSSCNISDISMISVYWSDIINKPGFCNVSITGSYNDLLNVPSLSTVAFSGDYNSLSNRPWINSDSNIYNNNQGNIGIGTNNPTEKLHLIGNFSIAGNIIPAINSNFNLGSSDYKWKDLYLSGNSIYLDNLVISRNSSNNLEIRDSNNNLRSISLNQLELNDGTDKLSFQYSNGGLIFNSNGVTIRGIEFSNYPNIIYSNNLYSTSNAIIDYTNYRINNLNFNTGGGTGGGTSININTDTIQIGTSNKFITSNTYSSNITFTNNLNVNGTYQLNNCNIPFSLMKYTNITTTNGVFTYNASSNDFGYFSFVNSGSITFPQTTNCDVLVVGAGGNGGSGSLSGGGGAGEVIAYPSYSFPAGSYTIEVGTSGTSSNNRISKISSNSIDLLNAKGGADGYGLQSNLLSTTCNFTINNQSRIIDYNYSNLTTMVNGTSNFIFSTDGAIITTSTYFSSVSNIVPRNWYKFNNPANIGIDSGSSPVNLSIVNTAPSIDSNNFIKGSSSILNIRNTTTPNYLKGIVNLSPPFTIAFWFYMNSENWHAPYGIGNDALSPAISCQYVSDGKLITYIAASTTWNPILTSVNVYFMPFKWYHYALTITSANPAACSMYINGVLNASGNGTGAFTTTANTNLYINIRGDLSASMPFGGNINDFRIYSSVLSASQILELFNSTIDRSYPILKDANNQTINPFIWYKFDSDTGLLVDSGTSGNNLTNNGVTLDSTTYIRGNSSIYFSGSTNNYAIINNNINFYTIQTTTGITVSLWAKINSSTSAGSGRLFHFSDSTQTNTGLYCISRSGSSTNLMFQLYSNGTQAYTTSTGINYFIDTWVHIVWSISTTGVWAIYINGVYINPNYTVNFPTQANNYTARRLGNGIFNEFFKGNLDDIRWYSQVLTQTQVNELYQGRVRVYGFLNSGGSGGGGYSNINVSSLIGSKWDSNYSYLSSGYNGTSNQGGSGGGALSNIGLTTSLVTGSALTIGEGGSGATLTSTPVLKTTYGSGGDGNGGTGTNGLVIVKVPLNTCNVKFDGFIYSSNIFDLNYNTITLMSLASNQLNASIVSASNKLIDYDNLVDKPWVNSNLIIYNNNQGNVGIGTNNPLSKLDVSGDINFTGTLRLNQRSLPFSVYSNTNILTSNGLFSYIPNNVFFGYYTFLTNGTITFPQTTACDIIVVGAGGNGGLSNLSGGGGAGEVIAFPSYSFTTGTYNIQIGTTNDISSSNLRNSIISSNNSSLITARGGGDGAYWFYNITGSGSYITSNINSSNLYIAFTSNISTLTLYQATTCDILVVGGGGGGGTAIGSGGGAGGVVYITNYTLSSGSYTITVGGGGLPMQTSTDVSTPNGGDSTIRDSNNSNIITALGGAIGSSQSTTALGTPPKSGGSGAGGTRNGITGGAGIQTSSSTISAISRQYGYGNAGGNSTNTAPWPTGGGGGAGAVGGNGSGAISGNGGNGVQIAITGINTYYGGGGGGGAYQDATPGLQPGTGGLGGGGNGCLGNTTASPGIANTGGGGGGAGGTNVTAGIGGSGGSGIVIIRFSLSNIATAAYSGGSGGGGMSSSFSNLSNAAVAGTKWNNTYSFITNGSNGTLTRGGNGGSALSNIGYTETITSNSFILGVGGIGATSTSVPSLKTTYGSGGDGNGGLGTQGIVIIKVPLNIQRPRFDGYINYSNIDNRPVLNDLITSTNYLNIGYYNQVNFPLGDVSWQNEWFLYIGRSPTSVASSFIFWHLTSNINSKWWFNGTQTSTNNEISDARIKKEINEIQNPLDKLMLIQPKEYYLCDEKDYLRKYGVIAQDVASNQELSHLVYKDDDFIANVYTTATYISSPKFLLITTTSIIDKVAVDDELKLLLDNMNIENIEIIIEETPYHNRYKKRYVKVKEIIDEFTIEIYEEIEVTENEKSNILIYGKKVNDFNKLDYSSLYSLNIACTQELYKIIQEQKNKIDQLEQRIIQLENR